MRNDMIFVLHIITTILVAFSLVPQQAITFTYYDDFEDGKMQTHIYVVAYDRTIYQEVTIDVTNLTFIEPERNMFGYMQRVAVDLTWLQTERYWIVRLYIEFPTNITYDYLVLGIRGNAGAYTPENKWTFWWFRGTYERYGGDIYLTGGITDVDLEIIIPGPYRIPLASDKYVDVALGYWGEISGFYIRGYNTDTARYGIYLIDYIDYIAAVKITQRNIIANLNIEIIAKDTEGTVELFIASASHIHTIAIQQNIYSLLASKLEDIAKISRDGTPAIYRVDYDLRYVDLAVVEYFTYMTDTYLSNMPREIVFLSHYPPIEYVFILSNDTHAYVIPILNATWVVPQSVLEELSEDLGGREIVWVGKLIVLNGTFTPFAIPPIYGAIPRPTTVYNFSTGRHELTGVQYSAAEITNFTYYSYGGYAGIIPHVVSVPDIAGEPELVWIPSWDNLDEAVALIKGTTVHIAKDVTLYNFYEVNTTQLFVGKEIDKLVAFANGTARIEITTETSFYNVTFRNYTFIDVNEYVNNIVFDNVTAYGFSYNKTVYLPSLYSKQIIHVNATGYLREEYTLEVNMTMKGVYAGTINISVVAIMKYDNETRVKYFPIELKGEAYVFPYAIAFKQYDIRIVFRAMYFPLVVVFTSGKRKEYGIIPAALALSSFIIPAPKPTITIFV